jgi:hypothetical protein
VLVGRRGRLLVRRCRIAAGGTDGLCLGPRVRAVVRGGHIEGNQGIGVRLASSAVVAWRANVCRDNRGGDWDVRPGGRLCIARTPD